MYKVNLFVLVFLCGINVKAGTTTEEVLTSSVQTLWQQVIDLKKQSEINQKPSNDQDDIQYSFYSKLPIVIMKTEEECQEEAFLKDQFYRQRYDSSPTKIRFLTTNSKILIEPKIDEISKLFEGYCRNIYSLCMPDDKSTHHMQDHFDACKARSEILFTHKFQEEFKPTTELAKSKSEYMVGSFGSDYSNYFNKIKELMEQGASKIDNEKSVVPPNLRSAIQRYLNETSEYCYFNPEEKYLPLDKRSPIRKFKLLETLGLFLNRMHWMDKQNGNINITIKELEFNKKYKGCIENLNSQTAIKLLKALYAEDNCIKISDLYKCYNENDYATKVFYKHISEIVDQPGTESFTPKKGLSDDKFSSMGGSYLCGKRRADNAAMKSKQIHKNEAYKSGKASEFDHVVQLTNIKKIFCDENHALIAAEKDCPRLLGEIEDIIRTEMKPLEDGLNDLQKLVLYKRLISSDE